MVAELSHSAESAEQKKYFLPYQRRWIQDESLQSIWDKSRRIGATYAESYKDVRGCVKGLWPAVWFSSADESAAREFIIYCEQWVKIYDIAAQSLGEIVIDSKNDIKAFVVEFANGARINALRSNPRSFRSKGGKVVLDEFAWHDDQEALWGAASPAVTWGFPISLLSTHNGKSCLYYRMIDEQRQAIARGERPDFTVHKTDIFQAVAEGLVDKILKRPASEAERQDFLDKCRRRCFDEYHWQQEYCCVPVDEATAFLTYDMILAVEDESAGKPEIYQGGPVFVGVDIARRRDLFVIWVDEKVGDVMWTREVVTRRGATFADQDAELDRVMRDYNVSRVCMDQTGMGEKPVEDAQRRYGKYKVEGVLMNPVVKQDLAFGIKRAVEDRQVRTPKSAEVRDDFHAVRKITTSSGNTRFDAEHTEQGHADRFWAKALAQHAGGTPAMEIAYRPAGERRVAMGSELRGFLPRGNAANY